MAYPKESRFGKGIDHVIQEVPGLIALAVVEISSGMSLASYSNQPTFDPDIAAAYNAEVVRQKQKAIAAIGIEEEIDDILITLESQLHLLKIIAEGKYFIYLAVDARLGNLALARMVLRKYAAEIGSLSLY